MNLAIVHYHLNRGGVTQVIANHLRSLDAALGSQRMKAAILYGGRSEGWPADIAAELKSIDPVLCPLPDLDYDDDHPRPQSVELAKRISAALEEIGFSPADTVLHVHNHSLGKNVSLPGALARLAEFGFPLLLQIHDFAEDCRAAMYEKLRDHLAGGDPQRLAETLYPQGEHVHYAALNDRDRQILRDAGVAEPRLHLLPNPVPDLPELPPKDEARKKLFERFDIPPERRFVLYPVRGIARKNLGELLLLSTLAGENTSYGVTLPPLNPVEKPGYEAWKTLAESPGLPVVFEAGGEAGLSFLENLAAADLIVTTSLAEGFGMVFLETWLAGRMLIGRDLPDITSDFVRSGLRLDALYRQLRIPVDLLGRDSVLREFRESLTPNLAAFGRSPDDATADAEIFADGHVDFGNLTAGLQAEVIRQADADASVRSSILAANPAAARIESLDLESARSTIEHNADVVRRCYSLPASGEKLLDLYRQLLSSRRELESPAIRGEAILRAFLAPARFRPVRSQL